MGINMEENNMVQNENGDKTVLLHDPVQDDLYRDSSSPDRQQPEYYDMPDNDRQSNGGSQSRSDADSDAGYQNGGYYQSSGAQNGGYCRNNGSQNGGYYQNNHFSNSGYYRNNGSQDTGYYHNSGSQNSGYCQGNESQKDTYPQNGYYLDNGYANQGKADYHNYNSYQPYGNMPPYTDNQLELEEPVKVSEWILSMALLMLPCVNIVMMFVWAFSNTEKKSKSNFFKAALIVYGIMMALMVLLWMVVIIFAALV